MGHIRYKCVNPGPYLLLSLPQFSHIKHRGKILTADLRFCFDVVSWSCLYLDGTTQQNVHNQKKKFPNVEAPKFVGAPFGPTV